MINVSLHYAFIDEAGSAALSRTSHTFVIAALCTENPRGVENIIKRAQKKFGSSLASGELKAKQSEDNLIKHVLASLALESIEIFTIVIDHKIYNKKNIDSEEIYQWLVLRLIKKLVSLYPRIEITLDRRYTNKTLRYKLEQYIRDGISNLHQNYVLIRQEDSQPQRGLQAIDFIAWALFQKYENGNDEYYQQFESRILDEEVVTKHSLDTE